ncbi:Pickpocket protein 11, partial [Gryllus bimaculatus]
LRMECGKIVKECLFKGPELPCCENFKPLMTEVGPCLAFNAKHAWPQLPCFVLRKEDFLLEEILETDETLSLSLLFFGLTKNYSAEEQYIKVYLLSNDEVPSVDAQPQALYDYRISHLFFSEKHTYTTPDTRQLSLRQRRCAFADEIRLKVDSKYTFNFCMIQCRMQLSRSLCGCVAPLYPPTEGFRVCGAQELQCLAAVAGELRTTLDCACDLGCDHTIYEIERLQEVQQCVRHQLLAFSDRRL